MEDPDPAHYGISSRGCQVLMLEFMYLMHQDVQDLWQKNISTALPNPYI